MFTRIPVGVKVAASVLGLFVGIAGGLFLLRDHSFAVLQPQGIIAAAQRDLIVFTTLLSLVVIVPVFVLLFVISWKYREGNPKKQKYMPEWAGNKWLEIVWWGVPCVIIGILSVVTWQTSHSLDPYKPIESKESPINVQVIAMQWKWLFIYPDQGVASLNSLQLPVDTPVSLTLTSDAPMNSFWIPNLAGQVYTMSGMSTKLHLMAKNTGEYAGSSANLSGEQFAKMKFTTHVVSKDDFTAWSKDAYETPDAMLDMDMYDILAKPNVPKYPMTYMLHDRQLYDKVIQKYSAHGGDSPEPMHHMEGM